MKNTSFKIFGIITILLTIASCSTRKDRFLNRALHQTTTKYNVLYNGKVAYNTQKKQLDDSYEDDFYNILPIEPLKISEDIALPKGPHSKSEDTKSNASGGFSKAEEKAVKAVQKHSMSIGGKEKNKQIDDAYLLLGKARYYDQRFVPALETFNFIIKNYPESKFLNLSRIWAAKSLIRLRNEDEAIDKLDLLLQLKELPDNIRHDALTTMAMAYTEQDSVNKVVELLDSTLLYKTKNHYQKARNLFILGQLYRQQQNIDSSNLAFEQLTNFKKAPYRFKINAKIERAKNYDKATDDTEEITKSLKKLIRNRDNRPFLDGIFYQLGKIELANNKTKEAESYFEKSLRTDKAHDNQKSLAYEAIGNIAFDDAAFLKSGTYYDSVLNTAKDSNSKRIRRLTRKRKGLDDVIRLEKTASINDSVLQLASLSKTEQEAFFNTYIKKLKKEDDIAKIVAENKKTTSGFGNTSNASSKQSAGGKFYFYNTQTVSFGQSEFQKIWGNRESGDNWRNSDRKTSNFNNTDTISEGETTIDTTIDESQKYDTAYYIGKIPTDDDVLAKLATDRNQAYYNLGLIYKEQFKKDELATTRLEKLLSFSPNEKMQLPTYYHLYKAYQSFDSTKSDFYKDKITTDYGSSKYAHIILNPNEVPDENNELSPEKIYEATYKLYLEEEYTSVLTKCKSHITQFENTAIVPKFKLLQSYAIAKTESKEKFIEALQFIVTNHPNTEEAEHALKVIASLNGEVVTPEKEPDNNEEAPKETPKKNVKKAKKKALKKGSKDLPSNEDMLKLIEKNKNKRMEMPRG